MPSWSASDFVSKPSPTPPEPTSTPEPPRKPAKTAVPPAKLAPPPATPPVPVRPKAAIPPATSGEIDLAEPLPPKTGAPPSPPRVQLPTSTCHHCGFTFQGKPQDRCPECSGPMLAGASDLLKFSAPAWSRAAAAAMTLAALGIVGHMAAAFVRFLAAAVGSPAAGERLRLVAALMHPAAALLLTIAVLITTRREHRPGIEPAASGLVSRFAAAGALALWIIAAVLFFLHFSWRGTTLPVMLSALLADAALAIAYGFYGHHLAGRLPDDSLRTHTLNAGWLCGFACLMFAGCHFFDLARPAYLIAFICAFPIIALGAALLIYPILILLRLANGLRLAANDADLVATRRRAAEFNAT